MALIACSDCGQQISGRATFCPTCGGPVTTEGASASDKERFDSCVDMMKAYYEAIEARLIASVTAFLVVIGWLIGSQDTRRALASNGWLAVVAVTGLTVATLMYSWNIFHWLDRWHEIRKTARELKYMEDRYYTRYERL